MSKLHAASVIAVLQISKSVISARYQSLQVLPKTVISANSFENCVSSNLGIMLPMAKLLSNSACIRNAPDKSVALQHGFGDDSRHPWAAYSENIFRLRSGLPIDISHIFGRYEKSTTGVVSESSNYRFSRIHFKTSLLGQFPIPPLPIPQRYVCPLRRSQIQKMDPISLLGTVAGLIALGQQLIPVIATFVDDVRSFPKEITQLMTEITGLTGVLSGLQVLFETLDSKPSKATGPILIMPY